jgi:hypothetical protein
VSGDVSVALAFLAAMDWRVPMEPWCLSGGLRNVAFRELLRLFCSDVELDF